MQTMLVTTSTLAVIYSAKYRDIH